MERVRQTLAWCWQKEGEPTELQKQTVDLPVLQSNDVLIKNEVVGLNPVDWKLVFFGHEFWQPGHIPGVDGMGTVIAVGDQIQHIQTGTRVCYHTNIHKNGSFAHHTIVPAKALMAVPDMLSNEAAAAFPCPGLTAWQAMKKVPSLAGRDVLVSGAGGSVGFYLLQMLVASGCRVYATAGKGNHERLIASGAVTVLDYKSNGWHSELKGLLGNRNLYAAFDMVSGEHAVSLAPLLGYYGHLVCIQDRAEKAPLKAFSTCVSLHEIALGAAHQYATDAQWAEVVAAGTGLLQKIALGEFKQNTFVMDTFDALPQKLAELKAGHSTQKFLIKLP